LTKCKFFSILYLVGFLFNGLIFSSGELMAYGRSGDRAGGAPGADFGYKGPTLGPGAVNPLGFFGNPGEAIAAELGVDPAAVSVGANVARAAITGDLGPLGQAALGWAGVDLGGWGDVANAARSAIGFFGNAPATGLVGLAGLLGGPLGWGLGFGLSRNNDPGLVSNALARQMQGMAMGEVGFADKEAAAIAAVQGLGAINPDTGEPEGLSHFGQPGMFAPEGFYDRSAYSVGMPIGERQKMRFARQMTAQNAAAYADAAAKARVGRAMADAAAWGGGPAGVAADRNRAIAAAAAAAQFGSPGMAAADRAAAAADRAADRAADAAGLSPAGRMGGPAGMGQGGPGMGGMGIGIGTGAGRGMAGGFAGPR